MDWELWLKGRHTIAHQAHLLRSPPPSLAENCRILPLFGNTKSEYLNIGLFIIQAECEDIVVKLDGMTKAEMADVMAKYKIVSPVTGNPLSGNASWP